MTFLCGAGADRTVGVIGVGDICGSEAVGDTRFVGENPGVLGTDFGNDARRVPLGCRRGQPFPIGKGFFDDTTGGGIGGGGADGTYCSECQPRVIGGIAGRIPKGLVKVLEAGPGI